MLSNPAYYALEINKDLSTKYSISSEVSQNGKRCFFIELSAENKAITIAGKTYHAGQKPHLSVYENYKKNEKHGLSVFHYTWYGTCEDINIVAHVYFNQAGKYLYTQIKNQKTQVKIQNFSQPEEVELERLAKEHTKTIIHTLLETIGKGLFIAEESVNEALEKLDKLSLNFNTQFGKYRMAANECVKTIQEKDRWTFDNRVDPRKALLEKVVAELAKQVKTPLNTNNQLGFFQQDNQKQQKNTSKKLNNKSQKTSKQQKPIPVKKIEHPKELLEDLNKVDAEIQANKHNGEKHEAEKAIIELGLFNKKMNIILNSNTPFHTVTAVDTMREINLQHKQIYKLFEKYALQSDLAAIQKLTPYIIFLLPAFLSEIILKKDFEICKHIMDHFEDVCTFYFNYICFHYDENKPQENPFTLLQVLYSVNAEPRLIEMFLKKGADPNFYGASFKNSHGILYLAVKNENCELVKLLLVNGADPNPKTGITTASPAQINRQDINILNIKPLRKQTPTVIDNYETPLHKSIRLQNLEVIELLLKNGASLTGVDKVGFDAMGVATCQKNFTPNLDIVGLLVKYGADINATQGKKIDKFTALLSACQRNDLKSVEGLISLGADPNQMLWSQSTAGLISVSPLLKAACKGNIEIVIYLMIQSKKPISCDNAAHTVATLFDVLGESKSIKIDFKELNPIFSCSLMIQLIYDTLFDKEQPCYTKEEISEASKSAIEIGTKLYQKKEYYEAKFQFLVPVLLTGNTQQKHAALYNFACCHKLLGEKKDAIYYYTVCIEHNPDSQIGKLANTQRQKLQQKQSENPIRAFGKK